MFCLGGVHWYQFKGCARQSALDLGSLMRITVHFLFNDQDKPAATTGVCGAVSDFIVPGVGDMVRHCDDGGAVFLGRVSDRLYSYDITDGVNVDGDVTITLSMSRVPIQ